MPDKEPSLLDRVKGIAAELGLEGEELDKYVGQHMEKAGWKRETNWLPPDGKTGSGKGNSGWFAE